MEYVTVTQFFEVGDDTILPLHAHVLKDPFHHSAADSSNFWQGRTKSHYSWYDGNVNQELLVCVSELLCSKALENLIACSYQPKKSGSAMSNPAYEFRKSEHLRILFTFKKYEFRQHILFHKQPSQHSPSLVPKASFISEHGRRVLPFLETTTHSGSCYSCQMLPEALHAFVDHFELTSTNGIFKVLSFLDPTYRLMSGDIASYFKTDDSDSKTEGVQPTSTKLSLRRGRSRATKSITTRGKLAKKRVEQSNLLKVFANYHKKMERKSGNIDSGIDNPPSGIVDDLSSTVIDRFFEFDMSSAGDAPLVVSCDNEDSDIGVEEEDVPVVISHDNEDGVEERGTPVFISHDDEDSDTGVEVGIAPCLTSQKRNHLPDESDGEDFETKRQRLHSPVKDQAYHKETTEEGDQDSNEQFGGLDPIFPNSPSTSAALQDIHLSHYDSHNSPGKLHTSTRSAGGIFDISDADIDAALFDIKTPDLQTSIANNSPSVTTSDLFPSSSQDQKHQSENVLPLSRSKSDSCVETTDKEPSHPHIRKSASDSVVQCHTALKKKSKGCMDDISNIYQSGKSRSASLLSDFDALFESEIYLENSGASDVGCEDELLPLADSSEKVISTESVVDLTEEPAIIDLDKEPRKTEIKSMEDIIKGKRVVKELTLKQIGLWMRYRKPVIVDIFKRKEFSQRHEDFMKSSKKRGALVYQMGTRLFRKEQVELVTDSLLKVFCSKHMKYFSYVMSVLLPECLIRIIADVHDIDFNEAELMMFTAHHQVETVDLTD